MCFEAKWAPKNKKGHVCMPLCHMVINCLPASSEYKQICISALICKINVNRTGFNCTAGSE